MHFRYLNQQYIKKQRMSDADKNFGFMLDSTEEQLMDIGEVNSVSLLGYWKLTHYVYTDIKVTFTQILDFGYFILIW